MTLAPQSSGGVAAWRRGGVGRGKHVPGNGYMLSEDDPGRDCMVEHAPPALAFGGGLLGFDAFLLAYVGTYVVYAGVIAAQAWANKVRLKFPLKASPWKLELKPRLDPFAICQSPAETGRATASRSRPSGRKEEVMVYSRSCV